MLRHLVARTSQQTSIFRAFSTATTSTGGARIAPGPTHSFEVYESLVKAREELMADPVKEQLHRRTKRQFEAFENRPFNVLKRVIVDKVPTTDSHAGLGLQGYKYQPNAVPNRVGIQELYDVKEYANKPLHLRVDPRTALKYVDQEEEGIVRTKLMSDPSTFRRLPRAKDQTKGTGERGVTRGKSYR